jgi:surface antigen
MSRAAAAANWTKAQSPRGRGGGMMRHREENGDAMNHIPAARIVLAAVLAASAGGARAINEMFAKDAPITRMTEEDFRIASGVMRHAFEDGRDGQEFGWQNPSTSASGTVTPVATFEKQGMKCRGAAFTITTRGETSRSEWNVCRTPGGWKVVEGR